MALLLRRGVRCLGISTQKKPATWLLVPVSSLWNSPRRQSSSSTSSSTQNASSYSSTLNLPKTKFSLRANAATREPLVQQSITRDLYKWQREALGKSSAGEWLLLDGPPYANGSLHMGHFLNKVLKDIVNRFQLLRGKRIHFTPGWDCHGLPIELKAVDQTLAEVGAAADGKSSSAGPTPVEIRAQAGAFAREAVELQRKSFERWGVMADWEQPYLTLDPRYEANQLEVFGAMVEAGLVYRGQKPVFWSPSSRTALAEAELEYQDDHVSPSVYVTFVFESFPPNLQHQWRHVLGSSGAVRALVWTTTPWTLPGNRAIAVNPLHTYALVRAHCAAPASSTAAAASPAAVLEKDGLLVVARDLMGSLSAKLGVRLEEVASCKGAALQGGTARHPLRGEGEEHYCVPVLGGGHVTTDSGTGLVHTAPAHGVEDYEACQVHGILDTHSLVDARGRFVAAAGERLAGKYVFKEGNEAVVEQLRGAGALCLLDPYTHRFPYDWRTKQPALMNATKQWFCKLTSIKEEALQLLTGVAMTPKSGRLAAMLESRKEWCISRQRSWGLPIPVFYHESTAGPALLTRETVAHVQQLFAEHGSDCWWQLPVEQLLPAHLCPVGHSPADYVKGVETMDVWFDSGSAWRACQGESSAAPPGKQVADLYLEGSDQHRGWFQSSLLTSVAVQGAAPFQHLVTHGFVLDAHKRKMSKSVGNVVQPEHFIEGLNEEGQQRQQSKAGEVGGEQQQSPARTKKQKKMQKNQQQQKKKKGSAAPVAYGADVLRVWAATVDFSGDVSVGEAVVVTASEQLRKVRNVARYILGVLNDFDPKKDGVATEAMAAMDAYALHTLLEFETQAAEAFAQYNFTKVFQLVMDACSNFLSSFYFDISKDILYCDLPTSPARRGCQTVLFRWLQVLTKALAPIAPYTAEDIYAHLPMPCKQAFGHAQQQVWAADAELAAFSSVFTCGWSAGSSSWGDAALAARFGVLRGAKSHVNKLLERARKAAEEQQHLAQLAGVATAEARVEVFALRGSSELEAFESVPLADINRIFMTASVTIHPLEALVSDTAELPPAASQQGQAALAEVFSTGACRGVGIRISRSSDHKCPRCWRFAVPPPSDEQRAEDEPVLCQRCADVGVDVEYMY